MNSVCTHTQLDVLDSYGDLHEDHETENCRCRACKGLFIATIWKTDRPTELVPMSPRMAQRYASWWV